MILTKYKFADFIRQRREKYNGNEKLPIRGVTQEGFINPKQEDADTSIYNVFYKNDFVFNPARMELNSIALNTLFDKAICSSLYEVFYVDRTDIVLPEYLNIYIKRSEFARRCWYEAIGSARNYFRVSALSEFEIELPDIATQQKYVAIYKAMQANQQSYERGLEDLKLVCDGYIKELRHSSPLKAIKEYITETNIRNDVGLTLDAVRGLATSKEMIATKADMTGVELKNYKVVYPRQIAYVPDTSRRGDKVSLGFNDSKSIVLVSSISTVFKTNHEYLLPEYLMLFLTRSEFDRYARFTSWGSARETFSFEDLGKMRVPIPSIAVQQSIVEVFTVYKRRSTICNKLKQQLSTMCPILIRGSLSDGG